MNKEIIELTEKIGKIYVEIAQLRAKREVLKAKRWEAKAKEINKK